MLKEKRQSIVNCRFNIIACAETWRSSFERSLTARISAARWRCRRSCASNWLHQLRHFGFLQVSWIRRPALDEIRTSLHLTDCSTKLRRPNDNLNTDFHTRDQKVFWQSDCCAETVIQHLGTVEVCRRPQRSRRLQSFHRTDGTCSAWFYRPLDRNRVEAKLLAGPVSKRLSVKFGSELVSMATRVLLFRRLAYLQWW